MVEFAISVPSTLNPPLGELTDAIPGPICASITNGILKKLNKKNVNNLVELVKVDFILICFKSLENEMIISSKIHFESCYTICYMNNSQWTFSQNNSNRKIFIWNALK